MAFAKALTREYHDGRLIDVTVGPRREVRLVVRLDPLWNGGDRADATVHISSISNFDEVVGYLRGVSGDTCSGRHLDEVLALRWTREGDLELELDRTGYIRICRPKVVEI